MFFIFETSPENLLDTSILADIKSSFNSPSAVTYAKDSSLSPSFLTGVPGGKFQSDGITTSDLNL